MAESIPPRPHLNALLICDQVYRESNTGKFFILGTFDRIWSRQFPCVHPAISLYVNFSDAEGPYRLRVEMVYLDEEQIIADARPDHPAIVEDRLAAFEAIFVFQGAEFKKPGKYALRFYANEDFIGDKTFYVVEREEAGGELI